MTLSEDQNPQQAPAPQGGEDQSRDDRSGRRRRRGRRGGGSREEGQPQRSESEASSASTPQEPQENRQQPPRRNVSGGAPDKPAESQLPAGDGQSPAGESGERSGRNRRRNRNRGRGEAGEATGANQQRPTQPAGQAPSAAQDRQRQQRPGQSQGQRPDQAKGEKKERPPRGSVLNRRSTRGEYVDTPKQREETPIYVPVSAATVEQYVNGHKGWQKEVLATLRGIVQAVDPDIEESIMWSQPVFSANGPVCFFKAYKDYVTFGFWRGTELSDPDGLLSGDLTMMRTITLRSAKDIRREVFEAMVKQAVRLNREKGDPTLS